jgi:hypothetical protein
LAFFQLSVSLQLVLHIAFDLLFIETNSADTLDLLLLFIRR